MNSIRAEFRGQSSAIGLELAQSFGDQATYAHEGATPVIVYVVPLGDELADQGSGDADIDVTTKSFDIPRQANWPPVHGITTGDEIVFDGHKWQIDTVKADSVGALYRVDCVSQRATAFRGE